ncbi:hypothetical protein Tco_0357454 [Tanacetum coccineum]
MKIRSDGGSWIPIVQRSENKAKNGDFQVRGIVASTRYVALALTRLRIPAAKIGNDKVLGEGMHGWLSYWLEGN